MSKPFAELPDSTGTPNAAAEKLYGQRTKGTFINPPGYEHAHATRSFGRAHMNWADGENVRHDTQDAVLGEPLAKLRGTADSWSVKGRPLK